MQWYDAVARVCGAWLNFKEKVIKGALLLICAWTLIYAALSIGIRINNWIVTCSQERQKYWGDFVTDNDGQAKIIMYVGNNCLIEGVKTKDRRWMMVPVNDYKAEVPLPGEIWNVHSPGNTSKIEPVAFHSK